MKASLFLLAVVLLILFYRLISNKLGRAEEERTPTRHRMRPCSHSFLSPCHGEVGGPYQCKWNKPLSDGAFDLQTHLLHGLMNSNGVGHLLCINGI